METRKSTRSEGISDAERSSTQSPIKKRRKFSLSLKKEKLLKTDGNELQDDNKIMPEPTAAVQSERSYPEIKDINTQEVIPSISSPETKCKCEPQHTRPNLLASSLPILQIDQQSKLTDLQQSSEGYYLYNFKFILDFVLQSSPERHVIVADGVPVVEQFKQLPQKEQQLYVRLFLRKHQWLRADKISYSDIAADLSPVLKALVHHGFLMDESQLSNPTEVLPLLQVSELRELRKHLNLPSCGQKAQIIESLFKHDREHKPLFGKSHFLASVVQRAKKKLGCCVKVAPHPVDVFSKITLLFSLTNGHLGEEDNELSQIVFKLLQVNIGALRYPDYEVSVSQSLFPTEESFLNYYGATKEEQALVDAIDNKDDASVNSVLDKIRTSFYSELQSDAICTTSLPPFLLLFTSCWLYATMLSKIAEYLEKSGKYERANEVLECLLCQGVVCRGSRGRWYERLALNCDYHLKNKEKCLEVIKRALDDSHVRPARRLSMIKRARKVCENLSRKHVKKKRGGPKKTEEHSRFDLDDFSEMELTAAPEITISGSILRTSVKPVYLTSSTIHTPHTTTPSQPCTAVTGVEGYAIHHYSASEGWPCAVHGEGSVFSTMFGLLMWEVLFAGGIADVFRTPYQRGPLDLHSDWFYKNRRDIIEDRLTWLRSASLEDIGGEVERCWSCNHGTMCVAVSWELFGTVEDAKSLAVCMGGGLLARVCDLFAKDFAHSCGGLPDLTLWNPADISCKFVEVKGPGDRLSTKQVVWLSRLAGWGCSVEVCHVKGSSNKILQLD